MMSRGSKSSLRGECGLVEVKSKYDAEFRRFSVDKNRMKEYEGFETLLASLHNIDQQSFVITYTDIHGDLLPINNNENFQKALSTAKPLLRVMVQMKGESYEQMNGYGTITKKKNKISKLMGSGANEPIAGAKPKLTIGLPEDFRRVSAIIDVDIVPEHHRRVKLMKNGSDKPLGFYIRDGTSVRVTPHGLEKVPGIFISRLVPGGLAESTGLLAVNDEVLEVNGIEVAGKTLDQVTDMMVANSSNLIITVKPVNQRLTLAPQRGGPGRHSQMSQASQASSQLSFNSQRSSKSFDSDHVQEQDDEDDEVHDHLLPAKKNTSNTQVVTL
ncbi:partitioning defective 6 homolog beta-like isoform X1 [Ostrea edulis]|uniref:partitioning defective 6 homolog beta-like isoform X1 n=2 Tax=Ostrea edulis TaxID=37623 RepID=UPI0020949F71|nr:partitioning defective 6 homolog beta-like isoform X1 [Ostrea edulis]